MTLPKESPAQLKESLVRRMKSFSQEERYAFFHGVSEYVEFVLSSPTLYSLIEDHIEPERRKAQKKIDSLQRKADKEIVVEGKRLIALVESRKISSQEVQEELSEVRETIAKLKIHQSPGMLYAEIITTLEALIKAGHRDTAVEFAGERVDDFYMSQYDFAPNYHLLQEEKERFEAQCKKALWGCWQQLAKVYAGIGAAKQKGLKKQSYLWPEYSESSERLLTNTFENKNPSKSESFQRSKYKVYLRTIQNFFLDKLQESQEGGKNQEIEGSDATDKVSCSYGGIELLYEFDPPYHVLSSKFQGELIRGKDIKAKELNALRELVKREGRICPLYVLENSCFGESDTDSLKIGSIRDVIYNLNNYFRNHGGPERMIKNKRSQGYLIQPKQEVS